MGGRARRKSGRVRERLAGLARLGAALVAASWLAGRVASDRWAWSQWLLWIPTPAAFAAAAACLALGAAIARPRRRTARAGARRVAAGAMLAWFAWLVGVEWRAWGWAPPRGDPAVRVVCWNATGAEGQRVAGPLAERRPDVVVLVNEPRGVRWGQLLTALGGERDAAVAGRVTVASAFPVRRHAGTPLGLRGRVPHPERDLPGAPPHAIDEGWACFVELDTRPRLGRTLVVWVIDLPSDPRLPRWEAAQDAGAAIAAWRGPAGETFPAPDLVVGDFNSPRGSAAVRRLTGGLPDAFAQGGAGPAGTYPRRLPLWHIDRAFVGAGLRGVRYRVADLGTGKHRAQVVDLGLAAGPAAR